MSAKAENVDTDSLDEFNDDTDSLDEFGRTFWDDLVKKSASQPVGDRVIRVRSEVSEDWTEFGDEIWPGSEALAAYVAAHAKDFAGQRLIEIGAGCGLPGLTAAAVGAKVVLCDLKEALKTLEGNALANDLSNVEVRELRWNFDVDTRGLENAIVIGSDVVYKESLVAPLLCTLRRLRPSRILLGNEVRSQHQPRFRRTLQAAGFEVKLLHQEQENVEILDGRPLEVGEFRLDKPAWVTNLRIDQDSTGADGFGGIVWPGAVALIDFAMSLVRGKRILDLGTGTGAVGLALSGVANDVCLADEFLALAAHNAARCGRANVILRPGLWNSQNDDLADLHFDVILGAELTPIAPSHDALINELLRLFRRHDTNNRGARSCHDTNRGARWCHDTNLSENLVAYLTAAPSPGSSIQDCPSATDRFIHSATQAGLHVHIHKNIPLRDAPGVDRTFDDGYDTIWILELGLL